MHFRNVLFCFGALALLHCNTARLSAQELTGDSLYNHYSALMDSVKNGNQAPDFKYPALNGDTIAQSGFKGKVIFIDLWATWCKPCVAEMPAFELLKTKYAESDIVFLSISLDEDFDKWKNHVLEKNMTGHQLFANGIYSVPVFYYTLASMPFSPKGTDIKPIAPTVPRYVLIGRDLTILNNNAPTPSSKELEIILDKLAE